MALYAIGDLHLGLSVNKPMNIFGPGWDNHVQRLQDAFSQLNDDDVTVLCGDSSWGIDFAEALADFKFIDALPGKKLICAGWKFSTKNRFACTLCQCQKGWIPTTWQGRVRRLIKSVWMQRCR